MAADPTEALVPLGFTPVEAAIYTFLLGESPATGYRIAQALGRPLSYVYKALEALAQKGAIVIDHGESRRCSPVPYKQLLATLRKRNAAAFETAEQALSEIGDTRTAESVYQLEHREQVIERVESMLERARDTALVVAAPALVGALRVSLERAAKRGVDVIVKTYHADIELAGIEVVPSAEKKEKVGEFPGIEVNVAVDGLEHLQALLSNDGSRVVQAVWTNGVYLSMMGFNALSVEIALTKIAGLIRRRATLAELDKVLSSIRSPVETRGAKELRKRTKHGR